MTKKILIFGKGQLGNSYFDYFQKGKYQVKFGESDITKIAEVEKEIQNLKPDIVINTAAKTNIDWCEIHREEAFKVNTLGADNLGLVCQKKKIYLVHLSSGCLQESRSAADKHLETDPVNPLCFYSWTKVWAENLLLDRINKRGIGQDFPYPLQALILRPRQLLSAFLSPRNALLKMLTYQNFVDTPNSCTVVEDLLYATEELIKRKAIGVFNVVNPGVTSPYKIALLLKKEIRPGMRIRKISKEKLNKMTLAKRIDSVLSTEKLENLGIKLPPLEKRLPEIVSVLKKNLASLEGQKVFLAVQAETRKKLSLK